MSFRKDSLSKNIAFTLAEILITLGIIGVVAALTIPALTTRYREKATVSKVKHTYSILSQGFRSAIDEYGEVSTWCDINASSGYEDCSAIIPEKLSHFVKMTPATNYIVKYKNRFNDHYIYIMGKNIWILNNGSVIQFKSDNGDKYSSWWGRTSLSSQSSAELYQGSCGYFYLDTNGYSGPNVEGMDLFKFHLYYDGVAPAGRKVEKVWNSSFENQCMGKRYSGTGMGHCTGWVVEKGNMDYLHYDNLTY